MNIVYVSQWFSSSGGGGEVLFTQIARGMAEHGHNVHIISHKLADFKEDDMGNVKIHRVNPSLSNFPPSYFQNVMFILSATWLGLRIIKQEKIDVIHVNNFTPILVGTILSKICKIPLVKTIHVVFSATPNYWNNWSKQLNVSRFTSKIGPLFEKLTIKLPADVIHTVSNSTKMDLIKYDAKSKIMVIPNLVNLSFYDKWSERKIYEDSVLFVGRLAFNKNLNVVISSFEKVIKKIPHAKLVIIGDGPMLEEWKKMAYDIGLKDKIIFTEFIPVTEKMDFLSKCSALILPSITEGLPTVVLESFAMSTPVILSDISPHRDIVEDGVDGFLVGSNDAAKWAEKIIYLLSNKEICRKMGKMGRIKVEEHYSNEIVLNRMESLYSSLIR
ncbi:MAG TPA: glycosyltransferase family 4 protein [Nitrososphaeraceae archaeon]|nr:glycosyltransferase family 4 protein [Nitrososphaeraceae archaeon]